MQATITYFEDLKTEDCAELEWEIEASFSQYDPGCTYGPPDRCYPPEGGELEDISAVCVEDKTLKLNGDQMVARFGQDQFDLIVDKLYDKACEEWEPDYYDGDYE